MLEREDTIQHESHNYHSGLYLFEGSCKKSQQAQTDSERWQINQSVLNQLSTRSQTIIKRVLESRTDVSEHHDRFGLHGRMCNRGKNIDELKHYLGLG